jgi:hypothetical protein
VDGGSAAPNWLFAHPPMRWPSPAFDRSPVRLCVAPAASLLTAGTTRAHARQHRDSHHDVVRVSPASPAAAVNGAADPSPSLAGSANGHEPESAATRSRCTVSPPPDREACRYPAKAGTDRCTLHVEYPGRRIDVTRWCAAWRPVLNAPCQSFTLPGSTFCAEHDGKPSTRATPVEDDMGPRNPPASGNGHRLPTTPPASSRAGPPALPTEERSARAAIVTAMGHSAGALLVLLHAAVEREQISWGSLQRVGEQEQLLTAAAGLLGDLMSPPASRARTLRPSR